jgi:hypothetical protein
MDISIETRGERKIIEGPPGAQLLRSANDVVYILEACFENYTRSVLLYAENLTEHFFDLSSGEAGAILQNLRNYHVKLAVVAPEGGVRQSRMFPEMVLEESRSGYFKIFEDRDAAEAWLAGE